MYVSACGSQLQQAEKQLLEFVKQNQETQKSVTLMLKERSLRAVRTVLNESPTKVTIRQANENTMSQFLSSFAETVGSISQNTPWEDEETVHKQKKRQQGMRI